MLLIVERSNTAFRALGTIARGVIIAASVAAFVGCGGGVGGYCYEAKNCEGGNDLDEEACNTYFAEIQDLADVQNCGSEFDAWFDCVEEQSRCNDDHYQVDEGACGPEEDQLYSCADLGGHF
jgi:hypothetical protein